MATGLYEALGIERDASPEQIRKAYKKKALQTHPDRLPRNVSAAEKEAAAESFRQINNAYEVLIDDQKRREYDRHGVWPIPDHPRPQRRGEHSGFSDPFNDTFFSSSFQSRPRGRSAFADPFDIFNSFFSEAPLDRGYDGLRHPSAGMFNQRPMAFGSAFSVIFGQETGGFTGRGPQGVSTSYSSAFNTGQTPHWVSESRITRSINGITESIHERRDSTGNTHVTIKRPDGRSIYTINGVEQASGGFVEAPRSSNNVHDYHPRNHRSNSRPRDLNNHQTWRW